MTKIRQQRFDDDGTISRVTIAIKIIENANGNVNNNKSCVHRRAAYSFYTRFQHRERNSKENVPFVRRRNDRRVCIGSTYTSDTIANPYWRRSGVSTVRADVVTRVCWLSRRDRRYTGGALLSRRFQTGAVVTAIGGRRHVAKSSK